MVGRKFIEIRLLFQLMVNGYVMCDTLGFLIPSRIEIRGTIVSKRAPY